MNEDYHVYIENNIAYDCMLNQVSGDQIIISMFVSFFFRIILFLSINKTNLQFNNNKYYLIQLLEQDKNKSYGVWFRWGRVGKKGQTSFDNCGGNLEKAKTVFETKFFDKTKNEWADKDMFEKVAGKYDLVHKDYAANNEDEEIKKIANKVDAKPVPKSKLDERIQKLIEFVCNVQEMESILKEMKYDAKKAPLGKPKFFCFVLFTVSVFYRID
jgi:poly [ADP-ribose] polymerase